MINKCDTGMLTSLFLYNFVYRLILLTQLLNRMQRISHRQGVVIFRLVMMKCLSCSSQDLAGRYIAKIVNSSNSSKYIWVGSTGIHNCSSCVYPFSFAIFPREWLSIIEGYLLAALEKEQILLEECMKVKSNVCPVHAGTI